MIVQRYVDRDNNMHTLQERIVPYPELARVGTRIYGWVVVDEWVRDIMDDLTVQLVELRRR